MKMTHAARHPINLRGPQQRNCAKSSCTIPAYRNRARRSWRILQRRRPNDGPLLTAGCTVIEWGFAHHPVVLVGVGHAATAVKGMAWALCETVSRKWLEGCICRAGRGEASSPL
jgi:hypothetical protein